MLGVGSYVKIIDDFSGSDPTRCFPIGAVGKIVDFVNEDSFKVVFEGAYYWYARDQVEELGPPTLERSAFDRQVGGSHYSSFNPQPWEFFMVNRLDHLKCDVIKRILRFDQPTGKGEEDLQKIEHDIALYRELRDSGKLTQGGRDDA